MFAASARPSFPAALRLFASPYLQRSVRFLAVARIVAGKVDPVRRVHARVNDIASVSGAKAGRRFLEIFHADSFPI